MSMEPICGRCGKPLGGGINHALCPPRSNQDILAEQIKDSGQRQEFSTGAVRDLSGNKGRWDLIPIEGLLRIARQMERGAAKYSERNWEKGMPLSRFVDSAMHHVIKHLVGYDDEPHLDAAIWNLMCLAEGQRRIEVGLWPAEFDDLPKTYKGITPNF